MKWANMKCPECGEPVAGTIETLMGEACLVEDGNGGFDYEGTTKIWWDEQRTCQVDGKDYLVCENGHEWTAERIKD